jgi:hypothetical protein
MNATPIKSMKTLDQTETNDAGLNDFAIQSYDRESSYPRGWNLFR